MALEARFNNDMDYVLMLYCHVHGVGICGIKMNDD